MQFPPPRPSSSSGFTHARPAPIPLRRAPTVHVARPTIPPGIRQPSPSSYRGPISPQYGINPPNVARTAPVPLPCSGAGPPTAPGSELPFRTLFVKIEENAIVFASTIAQVCHAMESIIRLFSDSNYEDMDPIFKHWGSLMSLFHNQVQALVILAHQSLHYLTYVCDSCMRMAAGFTAAGMSIPFHAQTLRRDPAGSARLFQVQEVLRPVPEEIIRRNHRGLEQTKDALQKFLGVWVHPELSFLRFFKKWEGVVIKLSAPLLRRKQMVAAEFTGPPVPEVAVSQLLASIRHIINSGDFQAKARVSLPTLFLFQESNCSERSHGS
ncbi:hypothetical protein T439DRAFT_59999 [Meredithblackwellia eburnea MCA 4105]